MDIHSLALLFLVILLSFSNVSAQDGDGIQVLDTAIENDFPNGLTFKISLQSQSEITGVKLYFKTQGALSTQSQPIDIESGTTVDASYTWDTSDFTVAPSTPISYYWQVTDEGGNRIKTMEETIYYNDIHFDWQEISSPEIILRWYEGDYEFGSKIFGIANRALAQMKRETNQELDFPVIILLYANEADFSSWQFYSHEWVGGLAFSRLGITAQILPPESDLFWIENVIPHEIAHLFFFQVINADIYYWPSWLNEGLAQYYEFSSNEDALYRVAQAAHDGDLLPLVLISGDFGSDPERAHLAYDQSYAVVYYMLESWGQDGLQRLVGNFRDGLAYREAVEDAYGLSWEEFEASWITWLGVPTTPAPPPTPTPTLVLIPTPKAMTFQTVTPDAESETESNQELPAATATTAEGISEPISTPRLIDRTPLILVGVIVGLAILGAIIVIVLLGRGKKPENS